MKTEGEMQSGDHSKFFGRISLNNIKETYLSHLKILSNFIGIHKKLSTSQATF